MNVTVYGRSAGDAEFSTLDSVRGGNDRWFKGPNGHSPTFGVRAVPMIDSRRCVFAEAGFNQDALRNFRTGSAGAAAGGFLAGLIGTANLCAANVPASAVALATGGGVAERRGPPPDVGPRAVRLAKASRLFSRALPKPASS